MPSLSLQELIESLRNLGGKVSPGDCIVRNRKGKNEVKYEGVANDIPNTISVGLRKQMRYKVELADGEYDGEVQYTLNDKGIINAVEITGKGTMHYRNDNTYTGTFWMGYRHGLGMMEFPTRKRTYAGEWNVDKMHTSGVLHFEGQACRYEGEIKGLCMHGKGKCQSPFFTFKGVFQNDIPVSGELEENGIGFRPMTTIESVEIFKQKPKELDEDTRTEYARQDEEQKEKDKQRRKPLLDKPPPVGHNWATHDF